MARSRVIVNGIEIYENGNVVIYNEGAHAAESKAAPSNLEFAYRFLLQTMEDKEGEGDEKRVDKFRNCLTANFTYNDYKYNSQGFRYLGTKTKSFIDYLFIKDFAKFNEIYLKVRNKGRFHQHFIDILLKSNIRGLSEQWSQRTVERLRSKLDEMSTHAQKLKAENARTESEELTTLSDKLKFALFSPSFIRQRDEKTNPSSEVSLTDSPLIEQRLEFMSILHLESKKQNWDNHRKPNRVFWANVLLGILGVGVIYGLAVCLNGGMFFKDTDRRNKLNGLQNALPEKEKILYTPNM